MNDAKNQSRIANLSASQINLYLQCSLKYRFQYIDRLPKLFKPSGLAFGSVIHSALEWFNKERVKGYKHSLEELLKIFEVDWFSQRVETDIRYKNGETQDSFLLMGKQMLTQYFHSNSANPVNAEIPFSLPLIEPMTGEVLGPTLDGIMDLIEENHTIVEFKTSAKTMNADDANDSLQLTCYGYAYEMLFQAKPRTLKIVDFVKTRTPKIVPLETTRNKRDIQRLFHLAKEILHSINEGIFFPRSCYMCQDCEFEEPCKKWGGNHA